MARDLLPAKSCSGMMLPSGRLWPHCDGRPSRGMTSAIAPKAVAQVFRVIISAADPNQTLANLANSRMDDLDNGL